MKQPSHYQQNSADCHDSSGDSRGQIGLGRPLGMGRKTLQIGVHFVLLLSLVRWAPASAISATSEPTSLDARVSYLVGQLRSDDATTRQNAAATLTHMGTLSRPAILKLTKSSDPGLAQQAAQILLNLPWYTNDDPPNVREALQRNYGSPDVQIRCDTVRQLAMFPNGQGFGALGRLIREEAIATITPKSAAGSMIRIPPATETKTSLLERR